MAKLKFNPNGYQDLGAYALLKNIVENGHLIAEDTGGEMFPNGFKEVTASRDFQSSDVDYLLAVISPDVQLTMPEASPFTNGQTLAVLSFAANTSVVTVYSGAPLNLLGGENVNEVVQFKYQDGELFIINTGQVFDFTDTLRKTALRYLMDKDAALEETAGKIIDLGTITYTDLNAAGADTDLFIVLNNQVPANYYVSEVLLSVNEGFDIGKIYSVALIDEVLSQDAFILPVLYNKTLDEVFKCNMIVAPTPRVSYVSAIPVYYSAHFKFGGGADPNPRDFTIGSLTIKAIVKKFPQ